MDVGMVVLDKLGCDDNLDDFGDKGTMEVTDEQHALLALFKTVLRDADHSQLRETAALAHYNRRRSCGHSATPEEVGAVKWWEQPWVDRDMEDTASVMAEVMEVVGQDQARDDANMKVALKAERSH
jgi:hypothetical protein